ncbi:MAG: arginine-tRNA-protein transferase [Bacteroidia bacterium]
MSARAKINDLILDSCLAMGYYRMQQNVFTTNILFQDEKIVPVFWLRTALQKIKLNKSIKELLRKNRDFEISIEAFHNDEEIENLFAVYKSAMNFQTSESVHAYLFDQTNADVFDSLSIKIRDKGKLIGIGIFDTGRQSIAGIMNIYHPEYKKYSLGKFLMLQKILYGLENNYQFYYTGYISTGTTKFDYKIFPDEYAMEIWHPFEMKWYPYPLLNKDILSELFTLNINI